MNRLEGSNYRDNVIRDTLRKELLRCFYCGIYWDILRHCNNILKRCVSSASSVFTFRNYFSYPPREHFLIQTFLFSSTVSRSLGAQMRSRYVKQLNLENR